METKKMTAAPPQVSSKKITRGAVLKGAAAVAGAAALARVQVGADLAYAADGRLPRSVKASFSIFGDDYNPTPSMVKTPDNPTPIHNLRVVADEYQRMYPGVQISIVTPHYANDDRRTWEVTQLTGDVAPEILQTPAQAIIPDMGKGWWVNLDPYLAQPNPYIPAGHPGRQHWLDEFYAAPTAVQRAPDGHLYALPYDFSSDLVYYNKTLFDKAGVTPPKTYAEFIAVLSKLNKAGFTAYGSRTPTSPWFQLGEMVMRRYEKKITHSGGGGSFTAKDVALAILHSVWGANTPEYRDYLQLLKLQVPYWKKDWAVYVGTVDPNVENQFQQGRIGILNSGTYMVSLLDANNQLPFKWGAFTYPTLTHGSGVGQSPYADGTPAPATSSADVMYAVTKTAREKGNLPVVIDFLRYISAPRQAGRIVNELGQKLPMEVGVPLKKDLASSLSSLYHSSGVGGMFFFQYTISTEAFQKVSALTTSYLLGRTSLDATVAAIQKEYVRQSRDAAAKFGWK